MAFVFAGLSIPLSVSTADLIYFAILGVFAVTAAVVVAVGTIYTIYNLRKFQRKNSEVRKRVALHALTVSIMLLTISIMIVIANTIGVNNSFSVFLYVRTLLAGLLGLALRVVLMIHYRFRGASSMSKTSDSKTRTDTKSNKPSSSRLQDDDESIDSPRTGVLEI